MTVASAAPAPECDVDAAIPILGRAPAVGVGGLAAYTNGTLVPTDTPGVDAGATQLFLPKESMSPRCRNRPCRMY